MQTCVPSLVQLRKGRRIVNRWVRTILLLRGCNDSCHLGIGPHIHCCQRLLSTKPPGHLGWVHLSCHFHQSKFEILAELPLWQCCRVWQMMELLFQVLLCNQQQQQQLITPSPILIKQLINQLQSQLTNQSNQLFQFSLQSLFNPIAQ